MRAARALVAFSFAATALSQSINIQVTKNVAHSIPSTLYGWMWEDINHSGDGGLYGEMLQNRAFQVVSPHTSGALAGWASYNGASLDVTNGTPGVSNALPNSLQVSVPSGKTGDVGFQNTGWWGIKVQSGWNYTGSFYAKSSAYTGSVKITLVSTSGQVFATATVSGVTSSWKKFTFNLTPSTSASNTGNVLRFALDGASAAGKTLNFGLFSLFPPTYKGRPNGMRVDLAEALAASKPGVFRFPGGNNLEGSSPATRWKWNETIGPLENRPGRQGNWGYANTDGLGLMDYLNWCEDIGAEPILGIYAGLSLGNPNPVVPQNQIQAYVQDAINEVQFITGDANSNQWAKLRAQYGRTQPYKLKYIEIGNEDFFGSDTYASYRWAAFVNGLKSAFPNSGFEYLATTYPSTKLNPPYTYIDQHTYNVPAWFIQHAFDFDNYSRSGAKVFYGEYAVTSTNPDCIYGSVSCGRLAYPTLQGAVAEAAFMTGLERNSDVVFASAYAPTLSNVASTQWTPNVASFDAGSMVKSASYYVQQMFGSNRGTEVLKTSPAPSSSVALHWVVSHDANSQTIYIKASNTATSQYTANFSLGFPVSTGTIGLTLLTASSITASNTLSNPNAVVPKSSTISVGSGATSFSYTFPAGSVAVFTIKTNW